MIADLPEFRYFILPECLSVHYYLMMIPGTIAVCCWFGDDGRWFQYNFVFTTFCHSTVFTDYDIHDTLHYRRLFDLPRFILPFEFILFGWPGVPRLWLLFLSWVLLYVTWLPRWSAYVLGAELTECCYVQVPFSAFIIPTFWMIRYIVELLLVSNCCGPFFVVVVHCLIYLFTDLVVILVVILDDGPLFQPLVKLFCCYWATVEVLFSVLLIVVPLWWLLICSVQITVQNRSFLTGMTSGDVYIGGEWGYSFWLIIIDCIICYDIVDVNTITVMVVVGIVSIYCYVFCLFCWIQCICCGDPDGEYSGDSGGILLYYGCLSVFYRWPHWATRCGDGIRWRYPVLLVEWFDTLLMRYYLLLTLEFIVGIYSTLICCHLTILLVPVLIVTDDICRCYLVVERTGCCDIVQYQIPSYFRPEDPAHYLFLPG